eukprot:3464469-Pyramimonas_sp.AAC.1
MALNALHIGDPIRTHGLSWSMIFSHSTCRSGSDRSHCTPFSSFRHRSNACPGLRPYDSVLLVNLPGPNSSDTCAPKKPRSFTRSSTSPSRLASMVCSTPRGP